MLARRAAIDDVGDMDERFFLYCEETDFCLRMRQAGWEVVHLPQMTIFHHSSSTGSDETLSRQMAFARRQYMEKHFAPVHRVAGTLALGLGYAIRSISPGRGQEGHAPTGRRALRARDAGRARAASVRLSVVTSRRASRRWRRTTTQGVTGGVASPAGLSTHIRGETRERNRSTL